MSERNWSRFGWVVLLSVGLCFGCGEDDSGAGDLDSGGTTGGSTGMEAMTSSNTSVSGTTGAPNTSMTSSPGTTAPNTTSNTTSATTGGGTGRPNNPIEVMCRELCEYGAACLQPICGVDLVEMLGEACVAGCVESPPSDREREELLAMSCEAYQANSCADEQMQQRCDCPDPNPDAGALGGPCEVDQDCVEEEGAQIYCMPERDPQTGRATGYVGGYCIQAACEDDADCGEGNVCSFMPGGQVCLAGCDPTEGAVDCREGYGCWAVSDELGACLPECTSDADCGPGGACDLEGVRACL